MMETSTLLAGLQVCCMGLGFSQRQKRLQPTSDMVASRAGHALNTHYLAKVRDTLSPFVPRRGGGGTYDMVIHTKSNWAGRGKLSASGASDTLNMELRQ